MILSHLLKCFSEPGPDSGKLGSGKITSFAFYILVSQNIALFNRGFGLWITNNYQNNLCKETEYMYSCFILRILSNKTISMNCVHYKACILACSLILMPFPKCSDLSQAPFTAYDRYLPFLCSCCYDFGRMDNTHAASFKDSAGWGKIILHDSSHNVCVFMYC